MRNHNPISATRKSAVLVTWGRRLPSLRSLRGGGVVLADASCSYIFEVHAFGTGFVLNRAGQVITCYHVVEQALASRSPRTQITLWQEDEFGFFNPHEVDFDAVSVSKPDDLAVLTPKRGELTNPLAGMPAGRSSTGKPVHYWGWYYSPERHLLLAVPRSGILTSEVIPANNGTSERTVFEGVAAEGSSGSALANDRGELVGMVSALSLRPGRPHDLGVAVPARTIAAALTRLGVEWALQE